MKFKVEPGIFEKFPGVRIGVLMVLGMDNTKGKKEIAQLLVEEEEKKKEEFAGVDLKEHPKIAPWREIYRKFGSKPREYRSSVEALLRRVISGSKLPNINSLVDLYNYISIKHLVPAGAEDLDKVKGDIVLGFANGDEKGKYIGSDEISTCYQGEVVYKDDLGFICCRWNWREGDRTKLMPESENTVVVIEANKNVSDQELELALNEAAKLIKKYLGAKVEIKILDAENIGFDIDFEPGKKLTKRDLAELREVKKTVLKEKVEEPEKIVKQKLFGIDRSSLAYKLAKLIYKAAVEALGKRAVKFEDIVVEHPANSEHGDYSTNIAMKLHTPPRRWTSFDLANQIVNTWRSFGLPEYIEKIEVAPPGFINIWLKNELLSAEIERVLKEKDKYGRSDIGKGKKIVLEHTSPNIIKMLHVGHIRNNVLGMTVGRVLKFLDYKVFLDCINNDRGIHICKAMWAYLAYGKKSKVKKKKGKIDWKEILEYWFKHQNEWLQPKDKKKKPDHFVDEFYVLGVKAEKDKQVKEQMHEILREWEKDEPKVMALWKKLTDWVHEGFAQTYERLGSHHDKNWYESKLYKEGKKMTLEAVKKGIFKKLPDGAILTNLDKYGLPNTIVIRSDGTALYLNFDPNLTKHKREKFKADLYIWDIGPEQTLYLKQLFAVCEQMGIGKREDYFHLSYGFVYLKSKGKMSSRAGTVVGADDLMEKMRARAMKVLEKSEIGAEYSKKEKEKIAEAVGIGALKYGMLKYSRSTDIQFDIDESLALEGNSAPYLQYTYARCQSVLCKAPELALTKRQPIGAPNVKLAEEELVLLRTIYKFPEVVAEAGKNFTPNLICNFLFDLAQKYNLFYNKCPILKAETPELVEGRLALTAATAQVLKNGLYLLGIEAPKRM